MNPPGGCLRINKVLCSTMTMRHLLQFFIVGFIILPFHLASAEDDPDYPTPAPNLTPAEVVLAQLRAMQNNDDPVENAGIAIAYQFAAPGNKAIFGPLDKFASMIHEGFPEMLNFNKLEMPEGQSKGPEALQPVILKKDNKTYLYLFYLRRQTEGNCVGCWMTESVMRPPGEYDNADEEMI